METFPLNYKSDLNHQISIEAKKLRLRAHKFGHLYFYVDLNGRTISDVLNAADIFYNSIIDPFYLITFPEDPEGLKQRALLKLKNNIPVYWKDMMGSMIRYKELVGDSCRPDAIEMIMKNQYDYDF